MNIGAKTYGDVDFMKKVDNSADFFEIMAIEGKDYSFLKNFSKPIVIHAQHESFGVNNADKTKKIKNLSSISCAIKMADKYKSKKIVLHPGRIDEKNCSEEEAISFINSIKDDRILIENVCYPESNLCLTPESMTRVLKETGKGFCFDINHAIVAAQYLNKDPYSFLEEFSKLKPQLYHLGGQDITLKDKTHLSFKNSNIDLNKIFKIIKRDIDITLEVTVNPSDTLYDIDFMRKFIKNNSSFNH